MLDRKSVYGNSDLEDDLSVLDAKAKEMDDFLKGHPNFKDGDIGFYYHKDGKFILDANAIITTAYKADEGGKFYMGFDGWYALINDVDGLKEFIEVEGL